MKDEVLPEFWQSVGLKQIATLYGGGTPARKTPAFFEGAIPWLTGADLSDEEVFSIRESREYITEEAIHKSATNPVPPKTVLITTRVNVGKVAVAEKEVCFSQDLTGIVIKEELQSVINPYYIAYYLLANKARILRYDRGTTISGIQRRDLARFRVWLPPLPEQERIVEILREADELRRQQQAALTRAQTLIPALFHHLFGDPATNPKGWPVGKLGDFLVTSPQNGLYKHSSFYGSGTPIIRIGDFYEGELNHPNTWKKLEVTDNEKANYSIQEGDILVNRVNSEEFVGKSALVEGLLETTVFESNMMRLVINPENLSSNFIITYLNTEYARSQMLRRAKRAINQASINQKDVVQLQIYTPPKDLIEYFNEVSAISKQTFLQHRQAFELIMILVESTLLQAFSGKLTEHYRQNNMDVLQMAANERDALLGHVRHVITPIIEEEVHVTGVLMGRDTLAHSLSLSQRTLLQTIVTYLTENGRRYFTLSGFLDDHINLPVNAVRQNVELLEKVGLLTRVSRQVAPEGIPYFETFYRLTTPLAREAAA